MYGLWDEKEEPGVLHNEGIKIWMRFPDKKDDRHWYFRSG